MEYSDRWMKKCSLWLLKQVWHRREENHKEKENGERRARGGWRVQWSFFKKNFLNLRDFPQWTLVGQWPSLWSWAYELMKIWKVVLIPSSHLWAMNLADFVFSSTNVLVPRDNVLSTAIFSVTLILHALRHQLHWTWCKHISWVLHDTHCEWQERVFLSSQVY